MNWQDNFITEKMLFVKLNYKIQRTRKIVFTLTNVAFSNWPVCIMNENLPPTVGAAFILYNCARLETMMRTYEEKVKQGVYPPLPDFNEVDFTLLTQEDEWILVFNYIMGFPSMLESCLDLKDDKCEFRPHFICSFLSSMVRVFSQYYRKTRILVEARSHLLPTIYARIHMLRILNDILKTCLKILNIKSVSQM